MPMGNSAVRLTSVSSPIANGWLLRMNQIRARPSSNATPSRPANASAEEAINDKVGVTPDVAQLANDLLKQKLTSIGATFAPQGESKPQAATLIKAKKLRGYLLRVNLLPNASNGLKLEILVMTYPEQSLQGSWNVKAAGAKYENLLKLMVPRVIDDASEDLEWKDK